ncbi:MAG: hypothetical protein JJU34_17990 [Lunatimonas sp.]|uniref:hypothetical protein n=1 Tax=Lunatimonas sp. TaxID=2060141 RepID=UPI00263B45EE|nr:hypothetical protein [Lunatimonas sp.]MCC5939176.1 hypothetical protein [Lunatimonas sp.]
MYKFKPIKPKQFAGKSGRHIRITNFHEEEWSIIESLSPEIAIADILKEYGLKSYDQHRQDSESAQIKARSGFSVGF